MQEKEVVTAVKKPHLLELKESTIGVLQGLIHLLHSPRGLHTRFPEGSHLRDTAVRSL